MTSKTKTDDMTAWEMACSLSAALRQAITKASAERTAIQAANPDKPYAPGISAALDIENSLSEAYRDLSINMSRIARSNGLPL